MIVFTFDDLVCLVAHFIKISNVPECIAMYAANIVVHESIPINIQVKLTKTIYKTSKYYIKKLFGFLHCVEKDADGLTLPASHEHGTKIWYKHDLIHRSDRDKSGLVLPAWEAYNAKMWYINGMLHRDDRDALYGKVLPAKIKLMKFSNEMLTKYEWWTCGKQHRNDRDDNGDLLPTIIYSDSQKGTCHCKNETCYCYCACQNVQFYINGEFRKNIHNSQYPCIHK